MSLELITRKGFQRRLQFKNLELKQKVIKSLLGKQCLPVGFKRKMMFKLDLLQKKKKSIVFFNRFCLDSGRNRGVYRFFKLARARIKELFM